MVLNFLWVYNCKHSRHLVHDSGPADGQKLFYNLYSILYGSCALEYLQKWLLITYCLSLLI